MIIMQKSNEKIGQLIYQIRQERGLTQAEFARKLGTSQSAVNRIEKGRQNLSLDTLGRISDVLNRQIINIGGDSVNLRIEGGHELSGEIELKASKNACVAILCASLLNRGTTTLKRTPKIEEVFRLIEVMESIGVKIRWTASNDLEIKPPAKFNMTGLNKDSAKRTRSAFMFTGALVHHLKSFSLPHAGGCELGKRTVQPHIYALEELGVKIHVTNTEYEITSKIEVPKRPIVMYESGDTATENVIIAASLTTGTTVIKLASANYMVQDLCYFLLKLGVKIDGIGTPTLKIQGLKSVPKKNVTYYPSEDPVEAMTFVAASIVTNSEITVKRMPVDFMELELLKLEKMGANFTYSPVYKAQNGYTDLMDVTVHKHNGSLVAPKEKLHPLPSLGLNIDNLPYFVPICGVAKGESLIHDWVYEERALMFMELKKIGMDIRLADVHRVYVDGPTKWKATDMVCPAGLRPAVLILIGMLAAKGTSILRNIYTINRGYEDLAERLNSLGAHISVEHSL